MKISVSKNNINVIGTAGTIPNNLNYSSDYNTLKYHMNGTTSVIQNYANYYGTYAGFFGGTRYRHIDLGTVYHGLGYVPFFSVFTLSPSGVASSYNMVPGFFAEVDIYLAFEAYADINNIYIQILEANSSNSGTYAYTFYYKIFRNNLGL